MKIPHLVAKYQFKHMISNQGQTNHHIESSHRKRRKWFGALPQKLFNAFILNARRNISKVEVFVRIRQFCQEGESVKSLTNETKCIILF